LRDEANLPLAQELHTAKARGWQAARSLSQPTQAKRVPPTHWQLTSPKENIYGAG